jgi:hypothetical protein
MTTDDQRPSMVSDVAEFLDEFARRSGCPGDSGRLAQGEPEAGVPSTSSVGTRRQSDTVELPTVEQHSPKA